MSDTVIKVENLSKKYIIAHQRQERYQTFRDTMAAQIKGWGRKLVHPLRSSENALIKTNKKEEFYALKDVCFGINRGDRVGIIGSNGAGKSTLLKILSRITEPTSGRVEIDGVVASLLEVGTGFHPELTGRENIFLNGAILGMTKSEIKQKFEEIVTFSEIEKFLDTPVKRYSSGMYVRLAFAVAAHLEPEILIVDEVLAVGDMQFQKKCLGKMEEVGKGGRTVLFVSHNMAAVRAICNRVIVLANGNIAWDCDTNDGVNRYISKNGAQTSGGSISWKDEESAPRNHEIALRSIRLLNHEQILSDTFDGRSEIFVEIRYRLFRRLKGMRLVFQLKTLDETIVFASTDQTAKPSELDSGNYCSIVQIPGNLLNSNRYMVFVHFGIPGVKVLIPGKNYLSLNCIDGGDHGSYYSEKWPGIISPKLNWIFKSEQKTLKNII